ncbi:MAG TPA: penicillin-binding protein 1C, partial [Pontibacter sp.]
QVGVHTFVQKLQQAEFSEMKRNGDQLGLSLILGGCGVSLEELTALYASLASQGNYSPTRWLQQDTAIVEKQLFSQASAYMLSQILTQLLRPDLPHNAQNSAHLPRIAWKTGTSYGRKDAWSIGYNKKYTIGVWVGNFSGEGVPELNGTDSATPLLFDIFNAIDYNSPNNWFSPPRTLAHRAVCAASGKPGNSFCHDLVMDTYIPGISPVAKCTHLKKVSVAADERYAYCTTCQPDAGVLQKWYPNYAPEILTFFNSERIPYQRIPEHNPACSRIFQQFAPVITSPAAEMEYILEREERQKLMLHCNAHNEVKQVYWYINDRFVKAAGAGEKVFFEPDRAGKYKISCTDDQGRNTNSYITVQFL